MDLDADFPRLHDLFIRLGVVHALHAIDPRLDAPPVGADDVFVPVVALDDRVERLHVRLGHQFVATRFVVDRAVPARLAVVALVAGHLGIIRHALAADLEAAVHEARARELDFETHDEVPVVLHAREKFVLLHLLGERAAANLALLRPPQFRIALPARERLAVKERRGFSCRRRFGVERECGEREEDEEAFHGGSGCGE